MSQAPNTGITSAPMSASITGAAMPLLHYSRALLVATWTAGTAEDPEGVLAAQVSTDNVTWVTLVDDAIVDLAFTADPDGTGAGAGSLALTDIAGRYLRVTYTRTAGDAGAALTVTVFLS